MEKQMKTPKLRFPEFFNEWEVKKLGEVCEKIQDGNYGGDYPKAEEFLRNGIPFLTSKAVGQHGAFIEEKIDFISAEKHKQLKKAHLKLNDILFTNRGSNVGSICHVDEKIAHGNIGPQLTLLRCKKELHFLYLKQIMISDIIQKQVQSQNSGSAMNFFGIGDTSKFKVTFPTLPEQIKIANFLRTVDDKLTQMKKKKNLMEQYKKGVIQKLFSQELRFKDENGNDFAEWEEKKLGEVAKFSKGKGISKADIIENGKIECIRYGELYTNYRETIKTIISKTNIDIKDLVLSKANDVIIPASGETQIDIATASCVLNSGIALGGDLNIIKTINNGVWLSYYLNSKKKKDIANLAQGVSVVHLYSSQLALLKIGLPSIPEQTKIANFLTAIDDKINHCGMQIEKMEGWKKGLLQRMFV